MNETITRKAIARLGFTPDRWLLVDVVGATEVPSTSVAWVEGPDANPRLLVKTRLAPTWCTRARKSETHSALCASN